jgi:inositol-phosphate transport system ATP-binding protein
MVEVRLEEVTKRFGKVVAVDHVSTVFEDGRFTVLLGPSGSGKSTILYLIAGIYKPTSGRILFGDRDVTHLPPRERNVGLVFQNYALYPHMTVYDNIAFPLRLRRVPEPEINTRVNNVARLLRIEQLLDRYPAQLSGGQQQRVALARALVKEPDVLLLDEPLSNLDALLRLTIRAELKRLQRKLGITAIHVTHDQAEAMSMADKVVIIEAGRLQQEGPPEEVYHRPRNIFVASFLGNPPANLIPAKVAYSDGHPVLRLAGTLFRPSERHAEKIREAGLESLVAAFRPEHARLAKEPPEAVEDLVIEATVYVVEPLGRENIVTLEAEAAPIKVVTPPDLKPDVGDTYYVHVPRSRILLFDPETGLNLDYL